MSDTVPALSYRIVMSYLVRVVREVSVVRNRRVRARPAFDFGEDVRILFVIGVIAGFGVVRFRQVRELVRLALGAGRLRGQVELRVELLLKDGREAGRLLRRRRVVGGGC